MMRGSRTNSISGSFLSSQRAAALNILAITSRQTLKKHISIYALLRVTDKI